MRPLVLGLLVVTGCRSDQGLLYQSLGDIALTAGDFDDVRQPFERHDVATQRYDGVIATATWDPSYDGDATALQVERLFSSMDELSKYHTVIVASGTRGLGATVYNGVAPDDQLVRDPEVIENMRCFVANGSTLVVTDWAYDLVEAAWPDEIDFLGDDTVLDAAQVGELETVTATVDDDRLQRAIDMDEMSVRFDYSTWAVIDRVDDADATIWMSADTTWRSSDTDGVTVHPDTPILVTLRPEGTDGGRVVVSAFHFDAQTDAVLDQLLGAVVGKLENDDTTVTAPIP
jgi:hypothetical protein